MSYVHGSPLLESSSAFESREFANRTSTTLGRGLGPYSTSIKKVKKEIKETKYEKGNRKIMPGRSQSISSSQSSDFELAQLLEPSLVHFAKSSLLLAMLTLLTLTFLWT